MSTNLDEEISTDEYIELELARMTAMPPLGGVARVVWDRAGIPDEPAGIVAEVGDQLSTYIDDELRKRGISPDTRMLSALADIVATAMIQQHEFTQLITNRSCLSAILPPTDRNSGGSHHE